MKKFGLILGGVLLVALVVFLVAKDNFVQGKATSEFTRYQNDFVGTTSGTSTQGVGFYTLPMPTATSTYVKKIGVDKSTVVLKVLNTAASSTSLLQMSLEGSNDDFCETTATDSTTDNVLVRDIKWNGLGNHVPGQTQTTAFTNSTSTVMYSWLNPMPGVSNEILLTNMNYHCMRLGILASSTLTYVGITTK